MTEQYSPVSNTEAAILKAANARGLSLTAVCKALGVPRTYATKVAKGEYMQDVAPLHDDLMDNWLAHRPEANVPARVTRKRSAPVFIPADMVPVLRAMINRGDDLGELATKFGYPRPSLSALKRKRTHKHIPAASPGALAKWEERHGFTKPEPAAEIEHVLAETAPPCDVEAAAALAREALPKARRAKRVSSAVTSEMAGLIKTMRGMGHAVQNIAAWFNINSGRVSEIMKGRHPKSSVPAATERAVTEWFVANLGGVPDLAGVVHSPVGGDTPAREVAPRTGGLVPAPLPGGEEQLLQFKLLAYELRLRGAFGNDGPVGALVDELIKALEKALSR